MTFTVSLLITGRRGAQENEGNIGTDCLVEGQVEPDTPLFFREIESPVFFPGYILFTCRIQLFLFRFIFSDYSIARQTKLQNL